MKPTHKRIIELTNLGHKTGEICQALNIGGHVVRYVRKKYPDLVNLPKPIDNNRELEKYDEYISTDIQTIILNASNILANKDLNTLKPEALSNILERLIKTERLLSGKSTVNIAQKTISQLDPESFKDAEDFVKSLVKSMLSQG